MESDRYYHEIKSLAEDLIDLAERLESRAVVSRETVQNKKRPVRFFLYSALVYARRQSQALLKLYPEHATEGKSIERSLVEVWINARWIMLRGDRKANARARRFAQFVAVNMVRILERAPRSYRNNPSFSPLLRSARRQRTAVRKLFRVRDKRGGLRWATTWAIDGTRQLESAEARVSDIAKHDPLFRDLSAPGFLYQVYRWLSEYSHVSQVAFESVTEIRGGRLVAKEAPGSGLSPNQAVNTLLELTGFVINEFSLSEFDGEHEEIQKRYIALESKALGDSGG